MTATVTARPVWMTDPVTTTSRTWPPLLHPTSATRALTSGTRTLCPSGQVPPPHPLTNSQGDYSRMTKWVTTILWQFPRLTIYNKTRQISFTSCRTATSNSDFQQRWVAYVFFFHDCEGRFLIRFLSMDLLRHQSPVFLLTTQDITYQISVKQFPLKLNVYTLEKLGNIVVGLTLMCVIKQGSNKNEYGSFHLSYISKVCCGSNLSLSKPPLLIFSTK